MKNQENNKIKTATQHIVLLDKKYRKYMKQCKIIWAILAIVTAVAISTCLFLIYKITSNYYSQSQHEQNLIATIGPQLFVLLLFIFLCPGILISFSWRWMLRKRKFDMAFYRINTINAQFHRSTGIYNKKNKNEIYENKINFIVSQTLLQTKTK